MTTIQKVETVVFNMKPDHVTTYARVQTARMSLNNGMFHYNKFPTVSHTGYLAILQELDWPKATV